MRRREFLTSVVHPAIAAGVFCSVQGCGTLLHRERCGEPHSNEIDWKIVAMNGLGLMLFFVPGVVAFAVDFYTGAIYLPVDKTFTGFDANPSPSAQPPYGAHPYAPPPPPQVGHGPQPPNQALGLKRVKVPAGELARPKIEQIVATHVGKPVRLNRDTTRVSALAQIDGFEKQVKLHRDQSDFGLHACQFFRQLAG